MGLDMYLEREIFIGANYEHLGIHGTVELFDGENKRIPVTLEKISSITERMIYWRKANQIHFWFVQNVQDGEDNCARYYVSGDNLRKLADDCLQVLQDHECAEDVLPTHSGCFFGSQEFDEWYFEDVAFTYKAITKILEECKDNLTGFYYHSSW